MTTIRETILTNLCYTPLVFARVNKKLALSLSSTEIESLTATIVSDPTNSIQKIGKNFYIFDNTKRIKLTINSYTYRLITASKL